MKVSDFFVGRLHDWGVRRIYGYPGDGINGVLGALQRAGSIEFIQVAMKKWRLSWRWPTPNSPAKSEFVYPPVVRERPT